MSWEKWVYELFTLGTQIGDGIRKAKEDYDKKRRGIPTRGWVPSSDDDSTPKKEPWEESFDKLVDDCKGQFEEFSS
jgi:hypothetical protein